MAAAAIDHRTLRIPNWLTFPSVTLGAVLLPFRCDVFTLCITGAVSCALVYGLWWCGLWGGGDAKLVLALALLVSPAYPPLVFLAALALCLALVLFTKHLFIRRGAGPMGPALFLAYVLSVAALEAF